MFLEEGDVIVLDFGCVRKFSSTFLEGTKLLYQHLKHKKMDCREAYSLWGFENLSKDLVETLNQWSAFLYGPITQNKMQKINESYNVGIGKS